MTETDLPTRREPIFNLPSVIVASIGLLAAIHAVRVLLLSVDQDIWVLTAFAFVPVRLTAPETFGIAWPGGLAGDAWTFVTYGLLHADWLHFGVNALWLAAFGTPLARRFGASRFLIFSAIGAAAGAAMHLAVHPLGEVPLVGASAAIAAQMAASARFVFSPGAALGGGFARADADHRPALSIGAMIADRRVLVFLGSWFALNIIFGYLLTPPGVAASAIAWEAHIGGFLAGLLLFPLFDPVGRQRG